MALFQNITTLEDLYVHTLQDIYYAETQITKALPKMASMATDPKLKQGLEDHLQETEGHIRRLDQVFGMLGLSPKGVDCPAIDGIIKEANEIAGDIADKSVLDAAIASSAQAVEHYEITRYGTLIAWSKELGRNDAAALLKQTLDEEYAADDKLTKVAEARLNRQAS
ncbi:ferritin-like domain-containing protein [Paracoccus sp. Z118]|uniref:YciE/YciF ferroxidase family protein n=1 Tax=Paracoccus sp. Z118 TaxID=2851017 RepID=UPI001C2BA7B2|nr:ferritin-like domain-containing protein [Paracoccus sp. Z118]MBV0891484.1 ferritin-like domain-containing protein [Paracoccus sp. Z118]